MLANAWLREGQKHISDVSAHSLRGEKIYSKRS